MPLRNPTALKNFLSTRQFSIIATFTLTGCAIGVMPVRTDCHSLLIKEAVLPESTNNFIGFPCTHPYNNRTEGAPS